MLTSELPEPQIVLSETSTPPRVLSDLTLLPLAIREETELHQQKRDAAIDLRIGLNMLGEHGRKLLSEYLTLKRQHVSDNIP